MAHARMVNARCVSARRSYLTMRRLNRESQANVRSTTQRCFPRWPLLAMPLRAILCLMPRLPRIRGMASSNGSIIRLSWTLAPLRRTVRGMPRLSVMMRRFAPRRPRSVGLGLVTSPPFWPRWMRCPCRPGSNRDHRRGEAAGARRGATSPRHRPIDSPATVASSHARAEPHLQKQHALGDAAAQDKHDSGQGGTVRNPRPPAFHGAGRWRQKRFDDGPERVGDMRDRHNPVI